MNTELLIQAYLSTLPDARDEESRIRAERSRDLRWLSRRAKDAQGRDTDQTNQEVLERAVRRALSRRIRQAKAQAQA
jgi:hypothetical protein